MDALFLIVAGLAVFAAGMMLVSKNAVHSALFLIVNFGCVAFLYLMLNAPFLAMIQIAVYAGAIMVLFLFVIMLLGAEKGETSLRRMLWMVPLALVLSSAFAVATYIVLQRDNFNLPGPAARQPALRVVHAAPGAGPVDLYLGDQLIAQNVAFGSATSFQPLLAGPYTLEVKGAGTQNAILTGPLNLVDDSSKTIPAYTAIAYVDPDGAPAVTLIPDNLETTDARTARFQVFNAYTAPVSVIDFGSAGDPNDDRTIAAEIAPGTLVELPPVPENASLRGWSFVDAGDNANVLFRMSNPEVYQVKRDTSSLLVFANEDLVDGTTRTVALPLVTTAAASFGGPQAIGELLFTEYMLPFQMIAILLLAAMVGAIVLTHKEGAEPRRRDVRRVVSKPLVSVIAAQVGQDVTKSEEAPQLPEQQAEPGGD